MRVQDDKITFKVFKAKRYPDIGEECFAMDEIESSALMDDSLEQLLAREMLSNNEEDED